MGLPPDSQLLPPPPSQPQGSFPYKVKGFTDGYLLTPWHHHSEVLTIATTDKRCKETCLSIHPETGASHLSVMASMCIRDDFSLFCRVPIPHYHSSSERIVQGNICKYTDPTCTHLWLMIEKLLYFWSSMNCSLWKSQGRWLVSCSCCRCGHLESQIYNQQDAASFLWSRSGLCSSCQTFPQRTNSTEGRVPTLR